MSAAAAPQSVPDDSASGRSTTVTQQLVVKRLVQWHLAAAVVWMVSSMTWGFIASLQFLHLSPFEGISFLSFGRIRLLHTNEIAYGALVNGFLGTLYYAIPRLTGRPVLSAKLGFLVFYIWQTLMIATSVGQLLGYAQGVEWGETPTGFKPGTFELNFVPVDFLIEVGALLVAAQFLTPIAKSMNKKMYVSLWYVSAGLVWLILTYVMGNSLVEWGFAGSSGAAVGGLFIHDLVGLFVTPMGWGMMYFFVPIILRRPVWSHALSVIGFWSLAFFYPLNGVHHFLLSSIPMSVQYGAVISTMAVEIVVTTVIVNFFGTMWGRAEALRTNLPIRWFFTGMILYFITCLQCAIHTTLSVQKVIHFTDWVPGHAHLVMFGVFSFWIIGIITWLWPRVTGNEWHNRRLNHWQYWLSIVGLTVMFIDLLAAGVMAGNMAEALSPWMDIVRALAPFWLVRTLAGGMMLAAQVLFAWNLWKTARNPKPYDYRVDLAGGAAGAPGDGGAL